MYKRGSEVLVLPGRVFGNIECGLSREELAHLAQDTRPSTPTEVVLQGRVIHSWIEAGARSRSVVEVGVGGRVLTLHGSRVVPVGDLVDLAGS